MLPRNVSIPWFASRFTTSCRPIVFFLLFTPAIIYRAMYHSLISRNQCIMINQARISWLIYEKPEIKERINLLVRSFLTTVKLENPFIEIVNSKETNLGNALFAKAFVCTLRFRAYWFVVADWRSKTFNSCEDIHDSFRTIREGKDNFMCTVLVRASGLFFVFFFLKTFANQTK